MNPVIIKVERQLWYGFHKDHRLARELAEEFSKLEKENAELKKKNERLMIENRKLRKENNQS